MQIITGTYRSRKLDFPKNINADSNLRPTKDRVREAGFAMLTSRTNWQGMKVFDLFSGSGAAGIEAISRGAEYVIFADTNLNFAEKNLAKLEIPQENYSTFKGNVLDFSPPHQADIIMLDPPYGKNLAEKTLEKAREFGRKGTLWLMEIESDYQPNINEADFAILKQKNYGKSQLVLLEQLCGC